MHALFLSGIENFFIFAGCAYCISFLYMKNFVFLLVGLWGLVLPALACTSAVVSGRATPDGRPLLWKHRDTDFLKNHVEFVRGEKFDADEWASLFKEAGARYVIPVAEHHDGFAMYDSDLNEWNAVKMGPKKDIIGLLKKAVEKQGMTFGVSSHRAENAWFFNGGMDFPSDVQDTAISLYGRRYKGWATYTDDVAREWLAHTYELLLKYQPSMIYFDWTVSGTDINTTSPSDPSLEDFGTELLTEFIGFAGGFMTYNEADNTISMYGYTFEALPLYG